jgi:DNA-binding protein H-NS
MDHIKDYTPEQLAGLPLNDLNVIQAHISKAIEIRNDLDKQDWRNQLKDLVQRSGFSLEELAGHDVLPKDKKTKDKKTKEKAAPKYRNPDNHEQTWAGKGIKTQWLKDALAAGRTLDEFEIK